MKMNKEDLEKLPYSLRQVHVARQKVSKDAHRRRSDFVSNWLENQKTPEKRSIQPKQTEISGGHSGHKKGNSFSKKPGEGKDITLEDKMVCGESGILEKPQPVFKERGVEEKKKK